MKYVTVRKKKKKDNSATDDGNDNDIGNDIDKMI